MPKDSAQKLDILSLTQDQFNQVYYNQIVKSLLAQKSILLSGESPISSFIEAYSFLTLLLWTGLCYMASFVSIQILPVAIISTLILIIFGSILSRKMKDSRYSLKEIFFSFFNVEYSRYSYFGKDNQRAREIADKWISEDFSIAMGKMSINFFKIIPDESLKINYKGKPLEILELNFRLNDQKGYLVISHYINKKFKGETIVKSIKEATKSVFSTKQEVYLEDPLFNKNFKIYADDQVEARYLLTSAFMQRVLDFQKKNNCTISFLFSNNISKESNIFLCIDFGRDFFELPDEKVWLHDSSHFYKICQEIKEIAQIFEPLKLDQDIGM